MLRRDPGTCLWPGAASLTESEQVVQPGTPILEIGDPGSLEIMVELLSRDAVRVRTGAAATITGWGGAPIAGVVERVEPSAVTKVSAPWD